MKILVVTNLYPPHHAGTFDLRCESVTEALKQRGHQMRVLTSNHGVSSEQRDPEIERRLWLNGIYDHPLVTDYKEMLALELHNHDALREAINEFQPELVYCWSLDGLSKSLVFGLWHSRLPTVFDVSDGWIAHGIAEDPWLRWWNAPGTNLARSSQELTGGRGRLDNTAPTRMVKGYDRLPDIYGTPDQRAKVEPESIAAFRFERLYFCSEAIRQTTMRAGFRVQHGEVIYPGIPTEIYLGEVKPMSAPMTKFLVVTALTARSGVLTVIQALMQARANGVKASLGIVGRGETAYIAEIRSLVVRHQLPVEFLTVSNVNKDLPAVLRQHHAFIYPAEWEEPFAITPLQAMAAGLPIIGTRIGGARELIRHGENALSYTPGDSLELASRIQELQMQPALRCQLAENAQGEVLARYNQTVVVDRIENYLNGTLEMWHFT
ncbi:MAG TPA: glycosyltransferase family 4 protein [Verrucomicrobiae bacterium]|nr:glycosyltransferase family 4 protein [Verrucomicrobiae bacterium]